MDFVIFGFFATKNDRFRGYFFVFHKNRIFDLFVLFVRIPKMILKTKIFLISKSQFNETNILVFSFGLQKNNSFFPDDFPRFFVT